MEFWSIGLLEYLIGRTISRAIACNGYTMYICRKQELEQFSYRNLIIIAGTGRNSGKTTLSCMLISRFSSLDLVAIKISPHFHKPGRGLVNWHIDDKFNIYRETSETGNKDSSRMHKSGAVEVYYIQAYDENVKEAFGLLIRSIPENKPVLCESPSLGKYINPGVLFITDNSEVTIKKDMSALLRKADRVFNDIPAGDDIDKLMFSGSRWIFFR